MGIYASGKERGNDSILFFILVFLLLFTDNNVFPRPNAVKANDSSILFFILVFLILFY